MDERDGLLLERSPLLLRPRLTRSVQPIAILAVPPLARAYTAARRHVYRGAVRSVPLPPSGRTTRPGRAALWLLPLLMVLWVNVHFGFAAGLGLIVAYAGTEVLELVFGGERRRAAIERLRRALPWFAGTAVATLVNPWGWGIYRALLLQQRASSEQQTWIAEWRGVRLNWQTASAAFTQGGLRSALFCCWPSRLSLG